MKPCTYEEELCTIHENVYSGKIDLSQALDMIFPILENIFNDERIVKDKHHLECFVKYEMIISCLLSYINNIITNKVISRKHHDYIDTIEFMLKMMLIRRRERSSIWHEIKRRFSFDLLDSFLTLCSEGICPIINKEHIYYLADISINCYVKERAFYYHEDGIGNDDDDQYFMAINKINKIFICQKKPELKSSVFDVDSLQVQKEYFYSARNRKAFWGYLTQNDICPQDNYCQACGFIEQQELLEEGSKGQYKDFIHNNLDKANGVDLYRFCNVKKHHV